MNKLRCIWCGLIGSMLAIALWTSQSKADDATEKPKPPPPTTPTEVVNPTATPKRPAADAKIDKNELLGHIQHLASPELKGREAGSAEQLVAARYVADEFKRYGLQAFGDEKDGARTWFQEFAMTHPKGAGKACALSMKIGDKEHEFKGGENFVPFPAGAGTARCKGGVVFAGYGITAPDLGYDDFKDQDLNGKWALILRYEPQEFDAKSKFNGTNHTQFAALMGKVYQCAMRKAAGVLIVTGPNGREKEDDKLPPMGPQLGDFKLPVLGISRATADELLKSSGKTIGGLQKAIDADLSNQSFVLKDVEVNGVSDIEFERKPTYNVIGYLPGRDPKLKEEVVVVGAHCDHIGTSGESSLLGREGVGKIHYGADDNASGTAGLLEVAQYIAGLKEEERPRRSILFMAFSGEEKGLLGSQYYLQHPKIPLKDTITMLNMDMIGRSPDGKVQVSGVGTSKGFKEIVQKYVSDPRLKVQIGSSGTGPSDHAAFYAKNIPVLFFFTGLHNDYHRPTDTWEKINAPVAEATASMCASILRDIADREQRPEFKKSESNAYLGVGPDEKLIEKTKGFPIGMVAPDSPAQKAGLKVGDVITAINGSAVQNAEDLPSNLVDFGPGDEIEVKISRDGSDGLMKVKLGTREVRRTVKREAKPEEKKAEQPAPKQEDPEAEAKKD